MDLAGGQPRTLCAIADVTHADWSRDDEILLGGMNRGLMRVSAQGGTPEPVTRLDPGKEELDHMAPVFLPDGKRFLYVARQTRGRLQAKWGSLDGRESGELPVPSGLLQFVPPDYLLFPREGAVFAQELDVKSMKLAGAPRMVAGPMWKGEGGGQAGSTFSQFPAMAFYRGCPRARPRSRNWSGSMPPEGAREWWAPPTITAASPFPPITGGSPWGFMIHPRSRRISGSST